MPNLQMLGAFDLSDRPLHRGGAAVTRPGPSARRCHTRAKAAAPRCRVC